MIQELLGGGNAPTTGLLSERKVSMPFYPHSSSSTTPILATTPIAATASSTTIANSTTNSPNGGGGNNNSNNSETNNSQNLRCPRCDSTNTKFCYYNNYNLTQPRHFCKTCRRYWTKGGTLRNVPIGGGCRKNRTAVASSSSTALSMSKSSPNAMAKAKATLSTEMLVNENSLYLGNGLLDHQLQQSGSGSILWPSLPQAQNSHILALLRGSNHFSNPNPNPSSSPMSSGFTNLKSEGSMGSDSYGNASPSVLGSYSRSNYNSQLNGFQSGAPDYGPNNGNSGSNILDLYQRLKSSTSNYGYCGNENNSGMVILGNLVGSSSAMNSTVLDAAPPIGGGENLGGYSFMSSPAISSWSDFSTVPINGAFP